MPGNGKYKTFDFDKSVQSLDQVKIGDYLKISFTEEAGAAGVGDVAVAPKGAKPVIVMATDSLAVEMVE